MTTGPEGLRQALSKTGSAWPLLTISDVVEIRGGYAAATKELDEKVRDLSMPDKETVPLIQSSDLKSAKEISITKRARKVDLEDKSKNVSIELFAPGKLLLAVARPETAGRCGLLKTEAIVNNAIQALTPKKYGKHVVQLDWLFYYFEWLDLQKYISNIMSGEGSEYFSQKRIKALPIPVPLPSEQTTVLQRIEDLLQEFKSAYDLLDQTELDLRNLLDPVLAKFFEPLEKNAHILRERLEDLVSIAIKPQDVRAPQYDNYSYIVPGTISPGIQRMENVSPISAESDKKIRQKPLSVLEGNSNLILYTLVEPALKRVAAFSEGQAICDSNNILPLTVKDPKLDPTFLMWSLIAPPFTRFATDQSGGTSIQRISRAKLVSYLLPLPTLVEQQAIVNQLKDIVYTHMEELRKKQSENRRSLDAVEQNILYKAFRGEL